MTERSVVELLPELATEVTTLVKSEAELIRAELRDKVDKVETAAGSMAAGGMCLFAARLILLQAIIVARANAGMGPGWASLLVGLLIAAIGIGLLSYAGGKLDNLMPRRSIEEARKTAQMAREKVR